jgi:SAM-dependent methyltransferase
MMAATDERQRQGPPIEKMPGHWLLAKMGKRVLRPGGWELTERLLADLAITTSDDVVEFAPGFGITARMTLARKPQSYIAVEREPAAAAAVATYLVGPNQRCILGTAEETGLPDCSASVVYGEAMLSMQPGAAKANIIAEAARLLRPGGRYGIHELCLMPDDIDESIRAAIQHEMSGDIHVGVRPLTGNEWCELLMAAGLTITAKHNAPMHLLEPARLVRDEGLLGAIRFVWNVARNPVARRRVRAMRRTFRKYRQHVAAIALVCTKS